MTPTKRFKPEKVYILPGVMPGPHGLFMPVTPNLESKIGYKGVGEIIFPNELLRLRPQEILIEMIKRSEYVDFEEI